MPGATTDRALDSSVANFVPDGLGHLAALGARGQDPVVGQAEADAQERGAEQDQEGDHGQGDRDRPAHHRGGDPVPEAGPGLPGGRGGGPAAEERQGEPVDPAAEHGQQGREHDQGADRGQGDHGDAGVAEGAQEVEGEHQQGEQGDGHGGGAEQHRAAGGAHGHDQGVGHLPAGPQLLAVAGDDEQAVVDGQAEAERGGQVEGVDGDVGDLGQDPQHEQGADDGEAADGQREGPGDGAGEHQHQQEQGDRDGDGLGPGQVGLDLLADLAEDLGLAADLDAEGGVVAGVGGGEGGRPLVHVLLVAGDAAQHQGLAAVGALEGRGARGPVGDDLGQVGLGGQPPGQGLPGGGHGRVVDLAALGRDQQDQVGVAGAELVPQDRGGPGRLGVGVVEPAGLEPGDGAPPEHAGGHHHGQRGREHRPSSPEQEPSQPLEHAVLLSLIA